MKKPVSVLVLIHTPELDILLLERAAHPGFWQSVTGSQEGDEPLLLTAAREVAEETGLSVPPDKLVDWHLTRRQVWQVVPKEMLTRLAEPVTLGTAEKRA